MRLNIGNFADLVCKISLKNKPQITKTRHTYKSGIPASAHCRYYASTFCHAQREKLVISTSDIVILVVASSALAVGIYRWHENTQDVSAITIPANSRMIIEPEPVNNGNNTLTAANSTSAPLDTQANATVVQTIPETTSVTNIEVPETQTQALGSHRVVAGDYLGKIANQYGTDAQTLRDLNGLRSSTIHVGDEILYPL